MRAVLSWQRFAAHPVQLRRLPCGANFGNCASMDVPGYEPRWLGFVGLALACVVGGSASAPAPTARNSAVGYCIAAPIGVTDVRVQ